MRQNTAVRTILLIRSDVSHTVQIQNQHIENRTDERRREKGTERGWKGCRKGTEKGNRKGNGKEVE
jgi:hypothetical protein